jgi:hypothetical protein
MRAEDPRLSGLYDDWRARKRFADRIAGDLGISRGELALYVGRDRGEKAIDLPFHGTHAAEVSALFRSRPGRQRLSIFAEKSHQSLRGSSKLEKAVARATEDLPLVESGHVFF